MKNFTKYCLAAMVGAVLLIAPSALADGTASLDLTSAGSNILGGDYVGPYAATINGATTLVVCDDYADDSYVGETWTATVTNLSNLTGTKWGNNTQEYNEMAWLLTEMFSTNNAGTIAQIQYAIWQITDSNAFNALSGSALAGAQSWLTQAENQTFYAGEFGDVTIYTPDTQFPILCGQGSCPTAPPQEFLTLTPTPEPGTILLFASGMALFGLLAWRKRAGMAALRSI